MAQRSSQDVRTYGSRVGDREEDPNNTGLNGDTRVNARLNTRINSRLNTRLDRFIAPQTDVKDAYTPKVDDKTKNSPNP